MEAAADDVGTFALKIQRGVAIGAGVLSVIGAIVALITGHMTAAAILGVVGLVCGGVYLWTSYALKSKVMREATGVITVADAAQDAFDQ